MLGLKWPWDYSLTDSQTNISDSGDFPLELPRTAIGLDWQSCLSLWVSLCLPLSLFYCSTTKCQSSMIKKERMMAHSLPKHKFTFSLTVDFKCRDGHGFVSLLHTGQKPETKNNLGTFWCDP